MNEQVLIYNLSRDARSSRQGRVEGQGAGVEQIEGR